MKAQDLGWAKSTADIIWGLVGTLCVVALVAAFLGLPLMLLWNWTIPSLFGLPEITFLQAIGLNLVSSILFKNGSSKSNK